MRVRRLKGRNEGDDVVGGGKGGAAKGGHLECLRHFSHSNAEFYVESPAFSLRVSGSLLGLVSMPF